MRKADDYIFRPALVHLQEYAVIDYAAYDSVHIVGLVRAVRNYVVEGVVHASRRI